MSNSARSNYVIMTRPGRCHAMPCVLRSGATKLLRHERDCIDLLFVAGAACFWRNADGNLGQTSLARSGRNRAFKRRDCRCTSNARVAARTNRKMEFDRRLDWRTGYYRKRVVCQRRAVSFGQLLRDARLAGGHPHFFGGWSDEKWAIARPMENAGNGLGISGRPYLERCWLLPESAGCILFWTGYLAGAAGRLPVNVSDVSARDSCCKHSDAATHRPSDCRLDYAPQLPPDNGSGPG